jgi:hypothetical protein
MTQLNLRSIMLFGVSAHGSYNKDKDLAKLTSVTFEVGGSVGHLHSFW